MTVMTLPLTPAMPTGGTIEPGAVWVGMLELEDLVDGSELLFVDDEGEPAVSYATARLLVRTAGVVVGYATVELTEGRATASAVREALRRSLDGDDIPAVTPLLAEDQPQPVTVVICTRDRAEQLRAALASVLALRDGAIEIVVVDNAPATDATQRVVSELDDPRVRYVLEPIAGLSTARNTGIEHASHDIVAFTDDDVIVDPLWVRAIRQGFLGAPDVMCVSGLVPSGELRNDVQRYFDARVSWSKIVQRREFRLSQPPADLPMFPFSVGEFGTGANFAVRKHAVEKLGGFDEALGVGTRTRGGEDIDMFVRMIFAGGAIVVEPSAIVWHRHRADMDALRAQAIGYGTGLGAWLTTVALTPRLLFPALWRAPRALVRLVRKPMETVDDAAPIDLGPQIDSIGRLELRKVWAGPWALLAERRSRRRARQERP